MTPADRSNSPPIISSATGTAMIPMVDDAYSTVPRLDARRKLSATIEKKTKTAAAPTTEPSSGRPSSRRSGERVQQPLVGPGRRGGAVRVVRHRVPRLVYFRQRGGVASW